MKAVHSSSYQENLLIEMARAGSLPAFNQLVLSYQDAAFRIAKWMLNDEACVEDIVQTVFLAAYGRIGSFRSNNFRAWLFRMIHIACRDEFRPRKGHSCLSLKPQDADSETVQTESWSTDSRPTPEETRIQPETWDWIERCLAQLPEPMREVVILIDIESCDYAEAASILGVSLRTIKSRLGRARACISQFMQKETLVPKGLEKRNTIIPVP